jgi:hypothetical protein
MVWDFFFGTEEVCDFFWNGESKKLRVKDVYSICASVWLRASVCEGVGRQ